MLLFVFAAAAGLLPASQCHFAAEINHAEAMMKVGRFEEAMTLLRQVQAAQPGCDPEEYHLFAIAAVNGRQNTLALDSIEKGIREFPAFVPLQEYYVSLLARLSSRDQAVQSLERALAISPQSVVYKKELGRTLLSRDPESARAGDLLSAVVNAAPFDAAARCLYAEWLFSAHRTQEAQEQVRFALAHLPRNASEQIDVYRTEASFAEEAGDAARARIAYRKAIGLNRSLAKPAVLAEWEFAQFLMRQSEDAEASGVLINLLKRRPEFGPAHFALAGIRARAGDYQEAFQEASAALQCKPPLTEQRKIHVFLSKTYHLAGREDEARVQEGWVERH